MKTMFLLVLIFVLLSGCNLPVGTPTETAPPEPTAVVPADTSVPTPTATSLPTIAPSSTPPPVPTMTPDPYAEWTVEGLRSRSYNPGNLEVVRVYGANEAFTRSEFRYTSDGLAVYGLLNVPQGEGPFPVIVAIHGYIEPSVYDTLDYTTTYADSLARAGYLVVHPNLRGYPPSDDGPNLFRVGFAVDVLNLIATVKAQAGQPGPLEKADAARIGLWGHSMGGGISTRVMVISPDVQAVVLYGAMSADEQRNAERIYYFFSNQERGLEELQTPADALLRISPLYFLQDVQAAVSIHHGTADDQVPVEWSEELCQQLTNLQKDVECFLYPGAPHTFYGDADQLFRERVTAFFDRVLK